MLHRRENSASHLKPPLNLAKRALTRALLSAIRAFIRANQRNKYFAAKRRCTDTYRGELSKKKPCILRLSRSTVHEQGLRLVSH